MEAPDIETISQELEEAVLQMENRQTKKKQMKPEEAAEIQVPEKRPKERIGFHGLHDSLIRPGDAYVAAFLVPVLIMVIIFIQRGIFPFGEESFLRTDMYHQYAPFSRNFSIN